MINYRTLSDQEIHDMGAGRQARRFSTRYASATNVDKAKTKRPQSECEPESGCRLQGRRRIHVYEHRSQAVASRRQLQSVSHRQKHQTHGKHQRPVGTYLELLPPERKRTWTPARRTLLTTYGSTPPNSSNGI